VLHLARQCATCAVDPAWLAHDNVARVRESISQSEFIARFEAPRIPVVLSSAASNFHGAVERWKHGMAHVAEHAEDARGWAFRTGAVTLSLRAFAAYSAGTTDESPLYIFDARFAKAAPELVREYAVPHWFAGPGRDLFELLGDARPDYRWLIAGAPKSGSKWCEVLEYTLKITRREQARGPELHACVELLSAGSQALAHAPARAAARRRVCQRRRRQRGAARVAR